MPVSYYLVKGLVKKDIDHTIKKIIRNMSSRQFDVIAVRGVSGLVLGPIIAYYLDKHLAVVRKDGDSCHREQSVECDLSSGSTLKYAILDDCIGRGHTVRTIRESMSKWYPYLGYCGTYLYTRQVWSDSPAAID